MAAAIASVSIQGFHFGINNNLFHVPLVLGWLDDAAFSDDNFIRSLRYFTSAVWPLVATVCTEDNVAAVFFALHLCSRLATIVALAAAAGTFGVRNLAASLFLPFWFGLIFVVVPSPSLGEGEIYTDFFTHTPLAIPLLLTAMMLAARGKISASLAMAGVIANINAFVAVWAVLAISAAALSGEADRKGLPKQFAIGAAFATLLAAPTIWWIHTAFAAQPGWGTFDYVQYLRQYYPGHSLVDEASNRSLLEFAYTAAAGGIGYQLIGKRAAAWKSGYLTLCGLVVLGSLLPFALPLQTLLELQLPRASGLVQLLSVLALTIAAIEAIGGPAGCRATAAAALCLMVLLPAAGVGVAALVLLAARRNDRKWDVALAVASSAIVLTIASPDLWPAEAVVAVVVGIFAIRPYLDAGADWTRPAVLMPIVSLALIPAAIKTFTVNRSFWTVPLQQVREAADWTSRSTAPDALFLVPLRSRPELSVPFQIHSRRRLWVDWKRGAAVMWAPSYYPEWTERMSDVAALKDLSSRLSYACSHHIDYVLEKVEIRHQPTPVAPVFENDYFRIFDARSRCR